MLKLWPSVAAWYRPAVVRGRKNPFHFALATRLKQSQRQSALTRLPLSKKAGISDTTIADIERGQRLPTVGTIARIAGALGLSAAWLAYGLGEQDDEGRAASCDGMGERLRMVRTDREHTRIALARLAELNPATIAKIEAGGQAGVDTIELLAIALNVSPGWLAYGIGDRALPARRRSRQAAQTAAES